MTNTSSNAHGCLYSILGVVSLLVASIVVITVVGIAAGYLFEVVERTTEALSR